MNSSSASYLSLEYVSLEQQDELQILKNNERLPRRYFSEWIGRVIIERLMKHIISPLPKEHPLVSRTLKEESPASFHQLKIPFEEDLPLLTEILLDEIISLWHRGVKSGSEVIFVFTEEFITIEYLCLSCLLERRRDSVKVYVQRESHRQIIPCLITMKEEIRAKKYGL